MTGARSLDLPSAVLLLHGWLSWVAEEHSQRALFIKGPGLQFLGLRDGHVSSDVDVMVDPAAFESFCALLEANGWSQRRSTFAGARYTEHSRTLIHPRWPCDIDVHRFFPGFIAPGDVVFDELWRRRVTMPAAGRDCSIPDRAGSLLVLGLHALRSRSDNARHARELAYLLEHAALDAEQRADLAALARRTGAEHTLAEVLRALDAISATPAPPVADPAEAAALMEWTRRVAAGASTGYMWTSIIRRQRGWRRIVTIRHAVWPQRADLLRMRPSTTDTAAGRTRVRLQRLLRGAPAASRAVAQLITEVRRSRR
ncbi:nucleotidyltransferase family protein [Rathayibacter sp. VKM Ac-2835]|uniref:nucleotidyltransferase family protein n=1 Tax=Rathayibacter sp. VKM Ac-2835 TaxID=2739043 RepID=UPI0015661F39|nr:nucleotidyltransferase family protein [Rathayibacter sp. VKM Ac-2835]NRG39816.1 nucleotidyltransferase family protein [Rathayibacter sp. VKM Ac-2835]